jgi:hypothetical protein
MEAIALWPCIPRVFWFLVLTARTALVTWFVIRDYNWDRPEKGTEEGPDPWD